MMAVSTDAGTVTLVSELDVDAVASRTLQCPSVMGLGDEIATYIGERMDVNAVGGGPSRLGGGLAS